MSEKKGRVKKEISEVCAFSQSITETFIPFYVETEHRIIGESLKRPIKKNTLKNSRMYICDAKLIDFSFFILKTKFSFIDK